MKLEKKKVLDKLLKIFINIIQWIWQLPQNVLALCLEHIYWGMSIRCPKYRGTIPIIINSLPGCITLGEYVFMHYDTPMKTLNHEVGHSKQSKILGPLYLIVIGVPSLLHCILHTLLYKVGITWDYYKFYTEYWANKLGKYEENR